MKPTAGRPAQNLLVALLILVTGVGEVSVTLAQTPTPPPGPKSTEQKTTGAKKDEKMTVKTAVGAVKSVSADRVVVVGRIKGKEAEWTFAVHATTRVRKTGKDVTATELMPGDPVRVRFTEHDGQSVAQSIAVTTPAKAAPARKQ